MFESITTSYTGADATIEILLIVLISMVIGWVARWVYEQIMFDDVYFDEDVLFDYKETDSSLEETVEPVAAPNPTPAPQAVNEIVLPQAIVMPHKQDDLKIIEGVGPKIEQLLQEGGITTWKILSETPAEQIKDLLRSAGERYRIHDPSTWPEQAMLAHEHKWDELEEFQDHLSGGKDLTKIYGNKG